jgi:hypothetical protein
MRWKAATACCCRACRSYVESTSRSSNYSSSITPRWPAWCGQGRARAGKGGKVGGEREEKAADQGIEADICLQEMSRKRAEQRADQPYLPESGSALLAHTNAHRAARCTTQYISGTWPRCGPLCGARVSAGVVPASLVHVWVWVESMLVVGAYVCACVRVCVCLCVCLCICLPVCACVCVCASGRLREVRNRS